MGVFKCTICGDPWAWDSLGPFGTSTVKHDCPGPPPAPDGEPARCAFCDKPDANWSPAQLALGKRGMKTGSGVEYHCTEAFYGAS